MIAKRFNKLVTSQKKPLCSALSVVGRLALFITPIWVMPLIEPASSDVIFNGNFENGNLSGWGRETCCNHSVQIITSPTREGRYAAKFTLYKDDPDEANSRRAELRLGPVPMNSENWYGFSNYLPDDYVKDPSREVVNQWHTRPDFDLGEDWPNPPIALETENGRWKISRRWDHRQVTIKGDYAGSEEIDLGAYETGVWTDWVFHIKWSYKADGLLEVWKNGKLVVRKTGPNVYNNRQGPFQKFGVYKAEWKYQPDLSTTTKRVIYYDSVRQGDASARYEDVAPSGSSPPPLSLRTIISEDFASTSTAFTEVAGGWDVSGGEYKLTNPVFLSSPGNSNISVHNKSILGDLTLTANANVVPTSSNWDDFSLVFNYQDSKNYYYANFNESDNENSNGIFKVSAGNVTELVDFATQISGGRTYNIRVEKTGSTIAVYRDGALQAIATDSSLRDGKVGFGSNNNAATFDNLVVQQKISD